MKLIDLLVQELPKRGGWPERAGYVVQDSDGEIKFGKMIAKLQRPESSGVWFRGPTNEMNCFNSTGCEDWQTSIITREQYEAALAASQQPAWNGEGLPPVGCECEALYDTDDEEWFRVIILAHDKKKVIGRWIDGEKEGELLDYPKLRSAFRIIRTEVQRNRDDTVKGISWMLEACDHRQGASVSTAAYIYDAITAHQIDGITTVPTVSQIVRCTEKCSREDAERIVAMLTGGTIAE